MKTRYILRFTVLLCGLAIVNGCDKDVENSEQFAPLNR